MLNRNHLLNLIDPHTTQLLALTQDADGRRELEEGIMTLLGETVGVNLCDYSVVCSDKVNTLEAVDTKYLCFSIYENSTKTCFEVTLGKDLLHITRTSLIDVECADIDGEPDN